MLAGTHVGRALSATEWVRTMDEGKQNRDSPLVRGQAYSCEGRASRKMKGE